MRVFAGPNGSGKSTIINKIRRTKVSGYPIDFGIYINADEIAKKLVKGHISFKGYNVSLDKKEFSKIALSSGLIDQNFSEQVFFKSFNISDDNLTLITQKHLDKIAQITAHVLREKLLKEKKKFSFETVFSHKSKIDIIERAKNQGYKIYFYFVSTESPTINKDRVELRVRQGGHNVPPDKIESRYFRSLDLMHEASQLVYQAFYFDNSQNGIEDENMFAHFKLNADGKKEWDIKDEDSVPEWFKTYYSRKVSGKKLHI